MSLRKPHRAERVWGLALGSGWTGSGTGDFDPRSGDFPESPKHPCLLFQKQAARTGEEQERPNRQAGVQGRGPRASHAPRALAGSAADNAAAPGVWGRGRQPVNSGREAPGLSVLPAPAPAVSTLLGQACGSGRGRSAGWGGAAGRREGGR